MGFPESAAGGQSTQNIALWANILVTLANRHEKWHFAADVEYQPRIDVIEFSPWNDLRKPPHLDPIGVLTHQKAVSVPFKEWPQRFAENGLIVPDYFEVHLRNLSNTICGDFLRASLSATDIIVSMLPSRAGKTARSSKHRTTVPERSDQSGQTSVRASDRAKPAKDELLSYDATVLLFWLLEFHGCVTDEPSMTAAKSQAWIANELTSRGTKFTQSRVSRTLEELLSHIPKILQKYKPRKQGKGREIDGAKTYKSLCESEVICDHLNNLYRSSNRCLDQLTKELEATVLGNLEHIKDHRQN